MILFGSSGLGMGDVSQRASCRSCRSNSQNGTATPRLGISSRGKGPAAPVAASRWNGT